MAYSGIHSESRSCQGCWGHISAHDLLVDVFESTCQPMESRYLDRKVEAPTESFLCGVVSDTSQIVWLSNFRLASLALSNSVQCLVGICVNSYYCHTTLASLRLFSSIDLRFFHTRSCNYQKETRMHLLPKYTSPTICYTTTEQFSPGYFVECDAVITRQLLHCACAMSFRLSRVVVQHKR